jgi:Protein of unknown function (DUF3307)
MLETAVALAFAHFLADFTLQTNAMIRAKNRPEVLLLHIGIVAAASWVALGLALVPALLALIAVSHFAIDWLKLRFGGRPPGFAAFALDQAGHLTMIALAATLFPGAWAASLWSDAATLVPWLVRLPAAMALGAGLIAAVWAGGYAIQALMQGLKLPGDPAADASLPQGGRLIGRLERLMILMLVLAGQTEGIGFLIAAKSILRFSELARDGDRRVSEYVIIGTLASFAWGLGAAFATTAVLSALAGP